jgi:hypothetical protein
MRRKTIPYCTINMKIVGKHHVFIIQGYCLITFFVVNKEEIIRTVP